MRTNNHAFINQLLVYTLFTICFSGSIGLGTVWMRHEISRTANASRILESKIAEFDRHIAENVTAIETQQDPALLKKLNAELHLGLVPPVVGQVITVKDDPASHLAAKQNHGLFGDAALTVRFINTDVPAPAKEATVALPLALPAQVRFASKN